MVHSNPNKAKTRVHQSQVRYIHNTHLDGPNLVYLVGSKS